MESPSGQEPLKREALAKRNGMVWKPIPSRLPARGEEWEPFVWERYRLDGNATAVRVQGVRSRDGAYRI